MSFGNIIEQIKELITGGDNTQQENNNVLPASQDPLGDPADQEAGFGNVRPASEDPLGDPADQEAGFGNVLPASQDPLGDPADQERR